MNLRNIILVFIFSLATFPAIAIEETSAVSSCEKPLQSSQDFSLAVSWQNSQESKNYSVSFMISGISHNEFLDKYSERMDEELQKQKYQHNGTGMDQYGDEKFPVAFDMGRLDDASEAIALAGKIKEFIETILKLECGPVSEPKPYED